MKKVFNSCSGAVLLSNLFTLSCEMSSFAKRISRLHYKGLASISLRHYYDGC